MLARYSSDTDIDFTRTTPDFPRTQGPEALAAMQAWIEVTRELFVSAWFEPLDLIALDDSVLVPIHLVVEGNSGAKVEQRMVYAFRLRDGQIVSAATLTSLDEARDAIGAPPGG